MVQYIHLNHFYSSYQDEVLLSFLCSKITIKYWHVNEWVEVSVLQQSEDPCFSGGNLELVGHRVGSWNNVCIDEASQDICDGGALKQKCKMSICNPWVFPLFWPVHIQDFVNALEVGYKRLHKSCLALLLHKETLFVGYRLGKDGRGVFRGCRPFPQRFYRCYNRVQNWIVNITRLIMTLYGSKFAPMWLPHSAHVSNVEQNIKLFYDSSLL